MNDHHKTCNRCKGNKTTDEKIRSISPIYTGYETIQITCPMCNGKGYITQKDIEDYYASFEFR